MRITLAGILIAASLLADCTGIQTIDPEITEEKGSEQIQKESTNTISMSDSSMMDSSMMDSSMMSGSMMSGSMPKPDSIVTQTNSTSQLPAGSVDHAAHH